MAQDDSEFSEPLDLPGEEQAPKRPSYPTHRPRRSFKKPLITLLVLIILGGLGYGAYQLLANRNTEPTPSSTPQKSTTAKAPAAANDAPNTTTTKTYKNDDLGFALSYPNTWTVTATSDSGVRLESPEFSYETTEGKSVSGYFRLYIRQQARAADSKYIGRGVAVQPSDKLTYAQPTATQRKETLVSSFGLDTDDNFAFLLVAGNFQLNKGDSLGPNYGKEQGTFIIGGGYSSKDLTDDLATHKVPLDWFAQTNAHKQAIEIIKSLQLQ